MIDLSLWKLLKTPFTGNGVFYNMAHVFILPFPGAEMDLLCSHLLLRDSECLFSEEFHA